MEKNELMLSYYIYLFRNPFITEYINQNLISLHFYNTERIEIYFTEYDYILIKKYYFEVINRDQCERKKNIFLKNGHEFMEEIIKIIKERVSNN